MRTTLALLALALALPPLCGGFAVAPLKRTFQSRSRLFADTRASEEPLFSAPLPGETSGRVVLPSGAQLRRLYDDIVAEIRDTGVSAGLQRTLQAQRALLLTAVAVARDADVAGELRGGSSLSTRSFARILRVLFENLGATYVKLGQFIASSPTLFPEDFVVEFQKCLDQAPPVPFSVIKRVIQDDFGKPAESLFRSIDSVPIATASIAQVHGATLKDGRRVVIKVRKPGVEEVLRTDLAFLAIATKIVETFAPELKRISLADITSDIRTSMINELDFKEEAENLRVFDAFLNQMGVQEAATCPLPIEGLVTKRVLTMTRLDGKPMLDVDAIRQVAGPRAEEAVITALNVWSLSIIACDFFHADVHGGNLLLLNDGRVGFIDFGIVGRLPPKVWNGVTGLGNALANEDYRGMARSLVAMGAADETVDEERFGRDLQTIFQRMQRMQPTVVIDSTDPRNPEMTLSENDEEEITRIVIDIVNAAEANGLKLPREFGLLTKQALYFDRYLKSLAPNLDVMNDPRIKLAGQM